METNPDYSSDETPQQGIKSKIAFYQSLESGDGSTQPTRKQSGKKGPTAESVLTKTTTLTSPSTETERSNKTFDEELRAEGGKVSKRKDSKDLLVTSNLHGGGRSQVPIRSVIQSRAGTRPDRIGCFPASSSRKYSSAMYEYNKPDLTRRFDEKFDGVRARIDEVPTRKSRSNETFDDMLRVEGGEVSKRKDRASSPRKYSSAMYEYNKPDLTRRFDDKFVEDVRTRTDEVSTRKSRSNETFDEVLRVEGGEVSKRKDRASSPRTFRSPTSECDEPNLTRRSDETFVEDIRARIGEVSRRGSSGCSSEDMEVFKKPMCLVWTEEGNTLKIDDRTVKEINKISWPMIIVAVVGLYRTGKSYLMNLLAGSEDGFDLGNTIQSKTKGIWVWCVIHPQKPNTVLLLIDTEGLGDIEKGDTNHDNKIFSLATLLCNCLVYNMKGAFDQDAVSKLTFITEMTKNIRFRKTSSQENEYLSLILPEFILCLRDFSLKLIKDKKTITEDEYLEGSLEEQKGKGDEFNKPRECIKKYFPVRKCFTFPVPGDIEVLEKLETMSFDDLPNRFKEATTRFVSYIYSLKPKELLASKPINGLMFTSLATHYVEAIRHGAIPDVDDAFLATAKIENSRIKDNALKIFEESMAKIILPIPSKNLDDIYTRAQNETLRYLRKNVVHDRDGHFEITTQSAMDTIWHELKRKNTDKIFDLCNEKIQDAFKPLKKNIDKKVYEVAGGHKKFQRDVNRMKDEFMSSLREFREHEILLTWLGFLETLKATESEIIEADDHLSEQEKEAERKHNEERMKELAKEHEQSKKEVFEEQRKLLQNHYDNLKREREIQLKEEQERYKELLEVKLEKEQMQNEMKRMKKEQKEHKKQLQEERERLQVLLHVKSEKDKIQREMDRMKKEQKEKKEKGIFSRIIDAIANE